MFAILDDQGSLVDTADGKAAAFRRQDFLQRITLRPHSVEPITALDVPHVEDEAA